MVPLVSGTHKIVLPLVSGTHNIVLPLVSGTHKIVLPLVSGTHKIVLPLVSGTHKIVLQLDIIIALAGTSGGFRAARLPGQATRTARARLMGGEKSGPSP